MVLNRELNNLEFAKLSRFIYQNYGIKMPPAKKGMLKARLQSRLRANNLETFSQYCDYVFSNNNETEIMHMIDVVSTNKTDFFREKAHFDFLESNILPQFCQEGRQRPLKIWSAACSSGEEVYSLTMVVNEFLEKHSCASFSVLGTDISSRILDKAKTAIYAEERVQPIPFSLKKKYLLRSIDKEKREVRVVPELRQKTNFKRLNLMDVKYDAEKDFDIIFCRNVLIYFDRETQEKVISKLCSHLKPGGFFFLGHSESINGLNVPLEQVRPTIYKKTLTTQKD